MTTPHPAADGAPRALPQETLRDIREKAEKATPGPWEVDPMTHYVISERANVCVSCDGGTLVDEQEANERFIAACDPQTVLRLVDEVERLRAEKEKK